MNRNDKPRNAARPLGLLSDYLYVLVRGRLWLQVLVGMLLGLLTGILIGPATGWVDPARAALIGNWLAFPGQIFLASIQMIVVPLVVASIIRGLAASENPAQLRRLGLLGVAYFVLTTALAIGLGLWIANLIQPGSFVSGETVRAALGSAPPVAAQPAGPPDLNELPDILVHLLPSNPLAAMAEGQMLQVVIFAVIVGVALVMMPPVQARPLLELLGSVQEVCMTIVRWAMWLAPLAVFGLMAQLTTRIGLGALLGMGVYVLTVLLGLAFLLGFYLLLVRLFAGRPPGAFLRSVRDVMLLAFSTSSSAAVMPLTIKTVEDKLGVRPSVSQFIVPLGATINMNGTALYQGVATVFLAQVFGIDLTLAGMLLIVVMAVGASIGSPATPGVGIVILAMVLDTVGIPTSGIALILGVDRILDMSRTAINVCGDIVASALLERWSPASQEQAVVGAGPAARA